MEDFVYVNNTSSEYPKLEINDVGHITINDENLPSIFFIRLNKELKISKKLITSFDIHKTGDTFDHKVCDRCFKRLNTKEWFSGNRIKKHGVVTNRPSCKSCRKIKDGKGISKSDRVIWDAKKPKDYTLFTCPICTKTTIVGLSKIVLDHCHKTGKVRGYLCESCNTGIGRFDDDPKLVEVAVSWLSKSL